MASNLGRNPRLAVVAALACAHCGGSGRPTAPDGPDADTDVVGLPDGANGLADGGVDAEPPPVDAARDSTASGNRNVCSVGAGKLAWTGSIPVSAETLVLSDVAAGPSDDVIVADQAGANYEQHRWDATGTVLAVHHDPLGSYKGTLWTSSILFDTHNNLFYGMLKTGLPQGSNSEAALTFTLLPPTGTPTVSPPITNAMPTSDGPPKVLLFLTGFDSGGGYHGPLAMASPQYFPAGVYCYGSTLTGEATSAQSVTATLTSEDFEWPAQSSSLYVLKGVKSSVDLGCGTVSVPAAGGAILASLDSGGSCQWNKLLGLPTASVKGKNFRVGADGTLALAVVYSGAIDIFGTTLTASGPSALAVARFDGSGNLLFAKSFGSATSKLRIGSLDVNAAGTLVVTAGYEGAVDLGGGALPHGDNTLLAAFDDKGGYKWSRTVSVDGSGKLLGAVGACGMVIATNSTSVDLGSGPLSTAASGKPASIGVAALGL